jgi:hypothetical protein
MAKNDSQDWLMNAIYNTKKADVKYGLAERIVQMTLKYRASFSMLHSHFSGLKLVYQWCQLKMDQIPRFVGDWYSEIHNELKEATALEPKQPDGWRRPSKISCTCKTCEEFARFLDDPESHTYDFNVPDKTQRHLDYKIFHDKLDVTTSEIKRASKSTLRLVKKTDSYYNSLVLYNENCRYLSELTEMVE